jgi:hypothetical protein
MPAKAFRTSKTSPAKSGETVVPVKSFPPSGLQVLTVPFAAAGPGHRVFHNFPVLTTTVVRFQGLTTILTVALWVMMTPSCFEGIQYLNLHGREMFVKMRT